MEAEDEQNLDSSSDTENNKSMESETENPRMEEIDDDDSFFEVLSMDQIVEDMTAFINEVNIVVRMSATTTRLLLSHCKWDRHKLLEKLYGGDQVDQENLFKKAGVVNPFIKDPLVEFQPKEHSSSAKLDCEICCRTLPEQMTGLDCGHRFCTDCWDEYLTKKIVEEGVDEIIACPAHDCPILVDDENVMRLIKDSEVKEQYRYLITNSFVENNKDLKWCSTPNCNNVIKVLNAESDEEVRNVTCRCGKSFCFECGKNYHQPVNCEYLNKWLQRCEENPRSVNLLSNKKDCPSCKTSIEKLGGCNRIKCKKSKCGYEFCWICLKSWCAFNSTQHICNRFKTYNSDCLHTRKSPLKRYLFYFNRYQNHKQSLVLETELYKKVQTKMEEMRLQDITWMEAKFLQEAVKILCLCRETLIYTYVFPYYLRKNNQVEIFENNQQDLQNSTESLSADLEQAITYEFNFEINKEKIQNTYKYCSSRRKALLKYVREGHEKNWWEYNSE